MIDRDRLQAEGVLAGVRVLEIAQNAAVPQCARLFAGLGADVVKVEPPTGDAMRHLAGVAPSESRAFATINPGKRAITLDLTSDAARPVVDRLVGWADIVLIGLKRPDVARYGLEWERLQAVNPTVIALVFNAYGPAGPMAEEPGYDMLVQATSGLGFIMNRSEHDVPLPTRPAFIDFGSGMAAAAAVLAALRHRDRTGVGQRVDASLFGTALSLGTPMLSRFDVDAEQTNELCEEIDVLRSAGVGFDDIRAHYERRVIAGGGVFRLYVRPYRTADGLISISGFSPALMQRFHDLTGVPALPPGRPIDDPEFVAVVRAAEDLFTTKTTDEWMQAFGEIGYPVARFNHPQEAVALEQATVNEFMVDVDHPVIGGYRTVGMPFSYSDTPSGISGPSPLLGEHTREVLVEVGFDAGEIDALTAAGVVTEPAASD